jgi:hypothetical protein
MNDVIPLPQESPNVAQYKPVLHFSSPKVAEPMQAATALVSLERETGRLKQGYDVWDVRGKLILRTLVMKRVLRHKASYFRVNATGKIYAVESKYKTVEMPAGSVAWR